MINVSASNSRAIIKIKFLKVKAVTKDFICKIIHQAFSFEKDLNRIRRDRDEFEKKESSLKENGKKEKKRGKKDKNIS